MTSIRLPQDLEEKLNSLSAREGITKSELVREALQEYIVNYEKAGRPYDLGQDLFGRHGSGDGTLSKTYKQKVREKIDARSAH